MKLPLNSWWFHWKYSVNVVHRLYILMGYLMETSTSICLKHQHFHEVNICATTYFWPLAWIWDIDCAMFCTLFSAFVSCLVFLLSLYLYNWASSCFAIHWHYLSYLMDIIHHTAWPLHCLLAHTVWVSATKAIAQVLRNFVFCCISILSAVSGAHSSLMAYLRVWMSGLHTVAADTHIGNLPVYRQVGLISSTDIRLSSAYSVASLGHHAL